ncbi:Lrp/AsnC family transcriptional regulator [Paludicola sp. MB14-C6]|uniref:Lrp/AsnC family transcriptional regulator n=1 Tax=Paludihabitans sp. MB14-C6 TaxID=3070656 RepID=UPI0027DCF737|nr:Lrp/AsnC family transcriptional regulator [Paludicola sp. MB14-C6]WMJ22619.1 Lrp/AsnC family transcriptional regulator [Paludicola sp. MB14-C6]
MNQIIKLLEENARYSNEEIAVMLNTTADDVRAQIDKLEKEGIIRGYKVIIDREKVSENHVEALIELKVTPKRDFGFDEIADKIAQYPEVEDLYLMSGGFDLALILSGKTFKDIALFVSQRLATLDSVVSTATHFVLSRYKEKGVIINNTSLDERGNASL